MIRGYQPVMSFGEAYTCMDRDFQRGDEMAAVAFLAQLVGSGSALELGIGMARIAGLRLKERWGGWHQEPFNANS